MFLLVPGRADTEISASLRKNVQRGNCLNEETWMAIGDACHHCAKLDTACATGSEGQRRIAFKHFVLRWPDIGNLEEMIHYPQAIETRLIGTLRDTAKSLPKLALPVGPCETGNL